MRIVEHGSLTFAFLRLASAAVARTLAAIDLHADQYLEIREELAKTYVSTALDDPNLLLLLGISHCQLIAAVRANDHLILCW